MVTLVTSVMQGQQIKILTDEELKDAQVDVGLLFPED